MISSSSHSSVDCRNQLPLHVAATHGATYGTFRRLLEHDIEAASTQDVQGKTPCHLLVQDQGKMRQSTTLHIVQRIAQVAPHSILLKDEDGRNVLDLAIVSGASLD